MNSLHIIILAAGEGTRMQSALPKVLHPVGGQPMLAHVLDRARELSPEAVHVVFNPERPEVREAIADGTPDGLLSPRWVPQAERLGTGHAVMQAMPEIPDDADVLVLYGDIPLLDGATLAALREAHGSALSLLTMKPATPAGYGRIVRDLAGGVAKIVEERDADEATRAIGEVNTGIVLAGAASLRGWLERLGTDNSQGEYYLTDIVALAHEDGVPIGSVTAEDATRLEGANDRVQLAALEARLRRLEAERLMWAGVTVRDPQRLDVRGRVEAERDVTLDINVVLEGDVRLGEGVTIGPGCVIRDSELAAGTRVHAHSVLEGVLTLGPCDIGPFARVRPGTKLSAGTRIGNFVETKNAVLGENSKASHLSYLGDSVIGERVNIGAGTITCNYDGVNKHRTVIEDGAFIGSDSQLVAPVTVGEGATIGAGSTISRDAPAGKLTISRARQATVKGWKRPVKKSAKED
ncbi:MAG: bifunctional UDP-N-acetylglucosamine diphosphorylase/glucosamine-1-phosphate N-acetyltransferase GlmU [Xanthomonadales bacterium]|jgi:bifunctional UDP-N-acetylglucosamine pyrophosphorylase/glucosamine-1-phosphate N-acetyltransferase|nr:bifunctional UDP-N-acetylglucosamine diphosphorylase/glucosamine-1-phosphate N-acetyltransferase GlmU [Xanthomonadales bacterium]